jgi:hypothetical protein
MIAFDAELAEDTEENHRGDPALRNFLFVPPCNLLCVLL